MEAEIYARLFETLSVLPEAATLDALTEVARTDRSNLLKHAMPVIKRNAALSAIVPVRLYRTLGTSLASGAASAAPLWAGCNRAVKQMTVQVQRALGTELTGPALAEELFDRILSTPSGIAFSSHEYDEVWNLMRDKTASSWTSRKCSSGWPV